MPVGGCKQAKPRALARGGASSRQRPAAIPEIHPKEQI
jgi:hypothetical protein